MSLSKPRPTDKTIFRHVRLSARLSVDMTFGQAGMVCEWSPCMPQRLTKAEERRYFAARNTCASELARLIGGSVVVGDLTRNAQAVGSLLVFFPDGRVERMQ